MSQRLTNIPKSQRWTSKPSSALMQRVQWVRVWKKHVKFAVFLLREPTKCWKITKWKLQLKSKLWYSETTTALRSKLLNQLPMRTLLPTWKDSWREWDPKEVQAMKQWKCSSRRSTEKKWLTKWSSLGMPHQIPLTKCLERGQLKVNHIGTVMDSLPQIWHNRWPVLRQKKLLPILFTWMLLTPSEILALRQAESQPHST